MSFVFAGLDHVQLAAPKGCEEEARRFFGEWLGMPEIEKPEKLKVRGGCWFEVGGGVQLHVGVEAEFAPAKKAHPAFRVQGAAALRERLLAHGIEVKDNDEIPGVMRFFFADPWGNRVEIIDVARN